jgi:hypothetical protein
MTIESVTEEAYCATCRRGLTHLLHGGLTLLLRA